MKNSKTRKLVAVALFGALSFVLMFFAFPILPAFPYLKVDFSDLPLLLAFFMYGPSGGIMAAFIRSVLHYIQTGGDMGYPIGDTASFLATLAYALPIYYLLKQNPDRKTFIKSLVAGTLSLTLVLSVANWLIISPLYLYIMNFDVGNMRDYILAGIVPFNLIKGAIVSTASFILLPRLKPWLFAQKNIALKNKRV